MVGSLEKEVGIGVCVSELLSVVVVPGDVGACVHSTTYIIYIYRLSWVTATAASS